MGETDDFNMYGFIRFDVATTVLDLPEATGDQVGCTGTLY